MEQKLRILLIGKTGVGKSSVGNTIIGERFSDCVIDSNPVEAKKVIVIDTPGIMDTSRQPNEISAEITNCIGLCVPGPHAIIIVMKAGRFTKEDVEVFDTYTDMFGESLMKYSVVVFTHFDHWKAIEGKTKNEAIEEFRKSFPETVNNFLKRIKNRYIMLDTKGTDVKNETKALMFAIEQLVKDNKNGYYSNQHFLASNKNQFRAESLGADENRRQKKKKNRRLITRSFIPRNIKRARSIFERETNSSTMLHFKRRYHNRD